jgi:hypothetical protein
MGAASGGDVDKAVIYPLDGGGGPFRVQYNPANFQFDKQVQWKEHEEQGQEATLEFQKNSPASLAFELTFDTTKDGADVRTAWVNRLLDLTLPKVTPQDGQASCIEKKRPPKVGFHWGDFKFDGVIENVSTSYMMFSAAGTPLRAKVQIKMKEWVPAEQYDVGGGSSAYGSSAVKLVTLKAGETITAVALRNGTTTQAICDANGIDDPLSAKAGQQVAVPQGR